MSFIETFNYDRNSITSGPVLGFTGSPIYGSSITFTADNSAWRGSNYYEHKMPNGINSINANIDLIFRGNKDSIKSLLRKVENATTGTITGETAFYGTEDCINFGESVEEVQINLDTDYYKNFSGSQINNYSLSHLSYDVYELNISMFNNRVSPVLNNGIGFIADKTVSINNSNFNKFDVAIADTGSANDSVFDNYFYFTGDRATPINISNIKGESTYTGYSQDCTRTFFWQPDQQVNLQISHAQRVNTLKRSFTQQLNISRNQNKIDQLQLKFTNRSEKETYSLIHFLESHLGYRSFIYYYGDDIINPKRSFYCSQWKHTFNYKNSNTIEAVFTEDVVPIQPEF